MAASMVVLSGGQDAAGRRRMEKATQVMSLLNNDQPSNADKPDPKNRISNNPASKRTPISSQASPRQQQRSHGKGAIGLAIQPCNILDHPECFIATQRNNPRAPLYKSGSSSISPVHSSQSPRSALSLSRSSSGSTGSPGDDCSFPSSHSQGSSNHRALDANSAAQERRPVGASRSHAVDSAPRLPLSNARCSSAACNDSSGSSEQAAFKPLSQSSSVCAASPRTNAHSHHRSSSSSSARGVSSSTSRTPHGPCEFPASHATPREAAAFSRPAGLRCSASLGKAAPAGEPQSRRLRHHDTWHGESLDCAGILTKHADRSLHASPRDALRPQLQQAHAANRALRAEPSSSPRDRASPRVPKASGPNYGVSKSKSDSVLATFPESRLQPRVARRTPSGDTSTPGTREMLTASLQAPRGRPSGPEESASPRIRRPAALAVNCGAIGEGAAPSDFSPTLEQSPSPRFPYTIPSPALSPPIHPASPNSPAPSRRTPRQPPLTAAAGAASAAHPVPQGQQRNVGVGGEKSRRVSRFHTWGGTQLDDEPTPNAVGGRCAGTSSAAQPGQARAFAALRKDDDKLSLDKRRAPGVVSGERGCIGAEGLATSTGPHRASRMIPQSRSLQQTLPAADSRSRRYCHSLEHPFVHSTLLLDLPGEEEEETEGPLDVEGPWCLEEEGGERMLAVAWEEREKEESAEGSEEEAEGAGKEWKRDVEGVTAGESKGGSNTGSGVSVVVKPKSKLQRSLSDDDEEEDRWKDERLKCYKGIVNKQQGKKAPLAKGSARKMADGKHRGSGLVPARSQPKVVVATGQRVVKRVSDM